MKSSSGATLVALQEYTSPTDSYTESELDRGLEEEEEEEEEYNEYEHLDPNDFSDGPGEVSVSSSHGSKPLQYSEPSVHGDGWSDYDSPSPGPHSERRRKRLRDRVDTPDDSLSPVSKMPKL